MKYASYAVPVYQSDYLKDTSGMEKITNYYSSLPTPKSWSVLDYMGTGKSQDSNGNTRYIDQFGKTIEDTTDNKGNVTQSAADKVNLINTYNSDLRNYINSGNYVDHVSKRFGKGAWNAPIEQYIDPFKLQDYDKNMFVGDNYNLTYLRTGRDLGVLPVQYNQYGQGGLHPQKADYYLDLSEELSRVDPNVFKLDVSKVTAPKYAIPGIGDKTALFKLGGY